MDSAIVQLSELHVMNIAEQGLRDEIGFDRIPAFCDGLPDPIDERTVDRWSLRQPVRQTACRRRERQVIDGLSADGLGLGAGGCAALGLRGVDLAKRAQARDVVR